LNKFPVGNFFLASGLMFLVGSGFKSCSGWTCYLLEQWLKTDCLAQIALVLLTRRRFPVNWKFWSSRFSLV